MLVSWVEAGILSVEEVEVGNDATSTDDRDGLGTHVHDPHASGGTNNHESHPGRVGDSGSDQNPDGSAHDGNDNGPHRGGDGDSSDDDGEKTNEQTGIVSQRRPRKQK